MQKNEVKNTGNIPSWIQESLRVLKPPEKLLVSEWANKYRVLDAKTSSEPGRWNNDRTPYLVEIMNTFNDPEIEEVIFLKSTQIGGTEVLNNIMCYIAAQDPAPAMVVYPILDLADWTSYNRLQPMFRLSPKTKECFIEKDSQRFELQFQGMFLSIAGANSPASLASKPIRYLFLDEIDKYPGNTAREANPIDLAQERTRTFTHNKKVFKTSTPTIGTGNIIKAFNKAETQKYYYVHCPHCEFLQKLIFQNIKFDKGSRFSDIRIQAYYECGKCKKPILNKHKAEMLKGGKWIAEKSEGKTKTAYFINCIYSPWLRFGDIAVKFLESKNDVEKLQNFKNSWLAEEWREMQSSLSTNIIFKRQTEYKRGIIPENALILTGGVDVQERSLYYSIRAWGENLTSWLIDYGEVERFQQIEKIMDFPFPTEQGNIRQVDLFAVDSGHKTDEVYNFCLQNQGLAVPVKGSSRQLQTFYNISKIEKEGSQAYGQALYIIDTGKYKDRIFGRLHKPNGEGSFMVFYGVGDDYVNQISAEEKIKDGNMFKWVKKTGGADNHYLDTEVYSFLAADLLDVRYLTAENKSFQDPILPKPNNNWLNNTKGWLK